MKLNLPKIIALMAVLISGVLLLSARGCNMTKLATSQKTETPTQLGSGEGGDTPNLQQTSVPTTANEDGHQPVITEWDSHNLVVLGENFIPVGDAFSTPFATFYRIDKDGYIPSNPMGPVNTDGPCQKKWYAPSRAAGVNIAVDAAEAITIAGQSNTAPDTPDCPRDLGGNLEAGSYVFDADGNDLAGFNFLNNSHMYEIRDHHDRRYLVFPEGNKGPTDDPAVKKMKLETIFIDGSVYPVGHNHDNAIKEIKNLIPGNTDTDIKYLPTKANGQTQEEVEDALVAAVQKDIEALVARLKKDIDAAIPDQQSSIVIGVRMSKLSSTELAEQQKRIKAKIKKALDAMEAKIAKRLIVVHFGSELPACAIGLSACRALNHSIAIYSL